MAKKKNQVKIVYIGKHKTVNYTGIFFDKDVPKDVDAEIAELLLKNKVEWKRAEGGDSQ